MVTPTIFDIAAITGFWPIGEDFDPNFMDEDTINSSDGKAILTQYINNHHDKIIEEVSDEEHIAFLTLWLSR